MPTMGGEFYMTRRIGFTDGIMGGNLWFLSTSEEHRSKRPNAR